LKSCTRARASSRWRSSKWRRALRALDAIEGVGLLARHPEIDLRSIRLGRFGREIHPDERLRDGDRIEILRPLAMGPMEARRLRARRKRR
jgi:putative ubiquitin-RnfH superfamily antitoxin RatB of RatAB toxin-antitoxin module